MKKNLILKTAVMMFASAALFVSCSKKELRTINVSGEGTVSFVPDIVKISINVKNVEPRLADSLAKTNATVKQLIDICKKYSVDDKDIKTGLVQTNKEYHWQYNPEKRVFDGYSSTQNTSITFRHIDEFEQFSEEILALDVTSLTDLTFDHSERSKYEAEANLLALDNAKESAEKLSGRINEKLGKVLKITDAAYSDAEGEAAVSANYYSKSLSSGITASPGILTVKKCINVKYEID
ncbi:uncharacterized protein YggE [Treponema rectale]|uniref:Uncharacterized protein YggE n=1 Tax=Treponema rectale TaxID=744512 RepID=A0A840SKT9_9SPIR|nr:SIMPL domain-containing protein [Treponema rectale]MBB5219971.1 uncharacterized protein YggE [Treponema rectale]